MIVIEIIIKSILSPILIPLLTIYYIFNPKSKSIIYFTNIKNNKLIVIILGLIFFTLNIYSLYDNEKENCFVTNNYASPALWSQRYCQ